MSDDLTDLYEAKRREREAAAVAANRRQAEAMERAADALELLAGLQMLRFDYDDDLPEYTVEALYQEAEFHGTGGEL